MEWEKNARVANAQLLDRSRSSERRPAALLVGRFVAQSSAEGHSQLGGAAERAAAAAAHYHRGAPLEGSWKSAWRLPNRSYNLSSVTLSMHLTLTSTSPRPHPRTTATPYLLHCSSTLPSSPCHARTSRRVCSRGRGRGRRHPPVRPLLCPDTLSSGPRSTQSWVRRCVGGPPSALRSRRDAVPRCQHRPLSSRRGSCIGLCRLPRPMLAAHFQPSRHVDTPTSPLVPRLECDDVQIEMQGL